MTDAGSRTEQTEAAKRPRWVAHLLTGIAILVTAALVVDEYYITSIEEDLFRMINGLPDFLERPFWLVMQFGNIVALPVAAVIALVFRHWRMAICFAVGTVAKLGLARIVKEVVVRYRPAQIYEQVELRDAPLRGQAFVSGHATVAVLLATLIHPYTTARWQKILIWTLAALTCFGRVYSGAHLPLDVIGGAGLGVAIGAVFHLVLGTPDAPIPESELEPDPEAEPQTA